MVIAALTNARRLPWFGLLAGAAGALVALGDLDRVRRLGFVELAIAAAGLLPPSPAFSGMYRKAAP